MFTRLCLLSATALSCSVLAVSASAQDTTAAPAPANLAYVEGAVDIVHEGVVERADPPVLLIEGDVVRTRNGRAEIVFGDGTLLHLDHDAEMEILAPERIRLLTGRVLMRMTAAAARPYVIDTPAASVRFDSSGEYTVVADEPRGHLEVSVARGTAAIDDTAQHVRVRAGETLVMAGSGTRPLLQSFNSARFDAFAMWSNDRINGFTSAGSAAQLPYELRPYGGVLDQYGRWDYVAPHGHVWFPSVSATWRPYYDGSWSHTRYGWTWHGRDRWAWPTHHYGRWGYNGGFWFWIPANVWGPAWVSWGFAPGYVSWSPLGWDGRPAIGFASRLDHPAYWPNDNPWKSWTIVPRDHFGHRRLVRAHAVDGNRLDESTRRAWIVQNAAPALPVGSAVPRGTISAPSSAGSLPAGNLRRGNTYSAPRQGNVRRPQTGDNEPAATPRDAVAGSPPPSRQPSRRATDAPAYTPRYAPPPPAAGATRRAPESTQDEEARRGGARYRAPDSGAARPAPPQSTAPPAVVAPPGSFARPRGVERGASEREPRGGGVPAPEATPQQRAPDRSGPDRSGPDRSGPDRSGPDRSGPDRSGAVRRPAAGPASSN